MLKRLISIEVMSSANRSRKYDSGSQKRKKKQRLDDLTQSQKGAMDRFVVKESQVSSNNHILDQSSALDSNVDNDPRDGDPQTENNVGVEEVPIGSKNNEMDGNGDNVGATNIEMDDNNNGDSFQPDIFDPRYWDSLDTKQIDILAQKGPKRDLSIQKGPRDRYSRRFSALFYNRNYQMESIVIEIGLSMLMTSVEYFALLVNYLQKDTERDSWQMRGIMIGHILVLDLKK